MLENKKNVFDVRGCQQAERADGGREGIIEGIIGAIICTNDKAHVFARLRLHLSGEPRECPPSKYVYPGGSGYLLPDESRDPERVPRSGKPYKRLHLQGYARVGESAQLYPCARSWLLW